jgi:hypothetical protein
VISSLSKSLNKAQKTGNVTKKLCYLGPGPSVAQNLYSEEEGVMSQVLTALTTVNAKLDLQTEKSIQLERNFKGLKADMEEVTTSSRSNKGRVEAYKTHLATK